MGYVLFSFVTGYPIKTKIPFYLVEELVADGQLLVVLLLLGDSHVLKTLLSLGGGRWGVDLDSFHAKGGSAALASRPLEVLLEVHGGVGVLSHCLTVEIGWSLGW